MSVRPPACVCQARSVAPLVESGEVVDALEVYDGDVVEHPVTGEVVTVEAHVHADPHYLHLLPGVVRFDVYDGIDEDGPLEREGPVHALVITEGMRLRRLWQYRVPPGFRVK